MPAGAQQTRKNKMPAGGEERASKEDILAIEREVLRAVCGSVSPGGSVLSATDFQGIESYRFRDYTHQVIFDALCEVRARLAANPQAGREPIPHQLAQRLTRKGFPDVEVDDLFRPARSSPDQIRQMIGQLTAADAGAADSDER